MLYMIKYKSKRNYTYKNRASKKIKKYKLSKLLSDNEINKMEGEFVDSSKYKYIINSDADVYSEDGDLLLKFRKNVIPERLNKIAYECLIEASKKKHDNRGAAAGPLDRKLLPKYVGEFLNPGKFRTNFVSSFSGNVSNQLVSNKASSNIIGYFDKPDRNLVWKYHKEGLKPPPCRLTSFSSKEVEKWKKVIPFFQYVDKIFKRLVPKNYAKQYERAAQTEFVIPKTCFSTVTINHNWRTALHKDAGDFTQGYGNLIVIDDNNYTGGYTGFPQYGVCVNVRRGDFLAMDVHKWHCNTELKKKEKKEFNRLSIVCYLREKMLRCKNLKNNE